MIINKNQRFLVRVQINSNFKIQYKAKGKRKPFYQNIPYLINLWRMRILSISYKPKIQKSLYS